MWVTDAAGFILHSRIFRESSSIIEVFSRDYGRLALVARDARAGKSRWRGLLQPFRQLELCWSKRGEMGTLTGLDVEPGWPELRGRELYCGFYLNELMLRLLPAGQPDERLYISYGRALHELGSGADPRVALRRFEKQMLEALGFALQLESERDDGRPVIAGRYYRHDPLAGPRRMPDSASRDVYPGEVLLALAADDYSDSALLPAMRRLLQQALRIQLGGRQLESQKILRKLL